MPIAIQDYSATRHLLKCLTPPPPKKGQEGTPQEEQGWVETRKMNNGERTYRQQISTDYTVEGVLGAKDSQTRVQIVVDALMLFDFKTCIVNHNLERAPGKLLDFSNEKDVRELSGIVGAEIASIISTENEFSKEEQDLLETYKKQS